MSDQHELRMLAHFFDHLVEAVEVSVVERRIDFVKETERTRFGQENREQKTTAVNAFSPPERSVMDWSFFPGG